MPLALVYPANTLSSGFEVANSVRFNDDDSPRLHKTPGSAGNRRTFTFSFWVKRCTLGAYQPLFDIGGNWADFKNDDTLRVGINATGSSSTHRVTNRVFRDVSAWYHIVIRVDTTQGTAANRLRIYINGTEETSMGTSADVTQDADTDVNNTGVHDILNDQSRYFDGYAAEIVLLDGTSAAPTEFGEFDEDSPTIWKPKDVSGLSFGTNGFYLDFEDSSNLGNDANGGTDLTEVNLAATDQCVDSPTNNFCTMNPLNLSSYGTLSEGNCLITGNSSSDTGNVASTMAASAGLWYAECKVGGKTADYPRPGFQHTNGTNYGKQVNGTDGGAGGLTDSGGVYAADGDKFVGDSLSSYGASFADNNIVNLAIDCDNGAAYVGVNGTWSNSSDPTSGASKTGAILTWTPADVTETGFAAVTYNSSNLSFNFGNPAYANSSDAADANGYGKFEYAPPSGYLALCTKNLGSDGG